MDELAHKTIADMHEHIRKLNEENRRLESENATLRHMSEMIAATDRERSAQAAAMHKALQTGVDLIEGDAAGAEWASGRRGFIAAAKAVIRLYKLEGGE